MYKLITYFFHAKIYGSDGIQVKYTSGSMDFKSYGGDLHEVYPSIMKELVSTYGVDETRIEITQLTRL